MADKNDQKTGDEALEEGLAAVDAGTPTDGATDKPTDGGPEGEQKLDPIEPPAHWDADTRERFRAADREWQEWLIGRHKDMEGDYTRKTQGIAPYRRIADQWQPYLQQRGVAHDVYFNTLAQLEHQLFTGTNQQKQAALMELARNYGVQFEDPNAQPSPEDDPFGIQAQIQAGLAPLHQQNMQMQQYLMQQGQAAQQQQARHGHQIIEEFRSAKGEDGKLSHPYFDELADDIIDAAAMVVQRGGTPDIAELYERASWANPSVRAKIQKDMEHAAKAEAAKAGQAKKDARATGGLTGGGGGGGAQPKSLDEVLAEQLDAMQGAA